METALPTTIHAHPLVILNPAANRGKMRPYRALLQQRIMHTPAEYIETRKPGEAEELAARAALAGRSIIIVGGDGSINEVVNGILKTGCTVPLGIVAAGSGNDFATQALKLPSTPAEAIERAFSGKPLMLDAGKVNGRYFANACSVGLDADIGETAGMLKKYPLMSGTRLYYTAVVHQLLFGYQRCPWLTIHRAEAETEAENVSLGDIARRYVLIAISNGPSYGAGFRINPAANCTDGLFDICTIDYTPLLRALKCLPIVRKGRHAGLPEVTFYRTRRIEIESQTPVTMQIDGEIEHGTNFTIEMLPGALCLRV